MFMKKGNNFTRVFSKLCLWIYNAKCCWSTNDFGCWSTIPPDVWKLNSNDWSPLEVDWLHIPQGLARSRPGRQNPQFGSPLPFIFSWCANVLSSTIGSWTTPINCHFTPWSGMVKTALHHSAAFGFVWTLAKMHFFIIIFPYVHHEVPYVFLWRSMIPTELPSTWMYDPIEPPYFCWWNPYVFIVNSRRNPVKIPLCHH